MTQFWRKIWAIFAIAILLVSQTSGASARGNLSPNVPDQLKPPTLVAPANGASTNDATPDFSWQADPGAVGGYEFQLDDNIDFLSLLVDQFPTQNTFTPGALSEGIYYWRVQSSDGVWSGWSEIWSVTIDLTPPAAPALISPPNGLFTNDNAVGFDWNTVTDANTYHLQVSTNNDFSSPVTDVTQVGTHYFSGGSLADGLYYWRVSAIDLAGNASGWSATWSLTVDTISPAAPILSLPLNGAFTNNTTPTFTWEASTGASQYTLEVAKNINFNNQDFSVTVSGLSFTPLSPMTTGKHYWHVLAVDAAGNSSAYSGSFNFTIDTIAPAVPVLTAPADGALINNNKPNFTWSTVIDASQYQIQVDDSSDLLTPVIDQLVSSPSFTPGSALSDGTYYWHVQAIDAAGNLSGYTTARSFTIDTVPPEVPLLTSPADGFLTNNNKPTFTWGAAAGASKYQIQVDNDGFSVPLLIDQMPTVTSFTPLSGLPDGTLSWRVQAIDTAGNLSGWSTVWSVVVDTTALGAPTLVAPLNGAFTNDTTPTFSWNAVAGAVEYQLQVDDDSGFLSPNYDMTTVATSDTPAAPLLSNVVLYWHVRTRDAASNWSVYSASRSFTIDTIAPAVPVLTAPANGATIGDNKPAFTWNASTGASQYQIQVDDSSNLLTPVIDQLVSTLSFTPGSALSDGTYYWHVQAIDAAGNLSGYTTARSFTIDTVPPEVPLLTSPANGFLTNNNKPIFTWGAAAGASKYQIQVDNDGFSVPLLIDQMPTVTSFTPLSGLPDGTLSWRVQAIDTAGNLSGWSTVWSVVVDTTALGAPTLVAPLNGAFTNDTTPTFSWNAVAGAVEYQLQVDDDSGFLSPNYDMTTVATSDTPAAPLLSNVVLYWHVRTRDAASNWSVYSASRSFTIDTIAPAVPVLTAPANGATIGDNKPAFTWNASTGASQYQIQVDDSSNLLTPVIDQLVSTLSFTPGIALSDGTYYWRVQAIDAAGNLSGWSTARSLVIDSTLPGTPSLISPVDGLITSDNIPTFTWSIPSGAIQTNIQVDDSNSFSSPLVNQTVGGSSFTWDTAFADGSYFWRVRAIDAAGNLSGWSTVRSFSVDTAPPGAPVLLDPGPGANTVDNTPTFDWTSPSGATQYQFQAYTGDNFTTLAIDKLVLQSTFTALPLTQGLYSWRVKAGDAANNWSAWSDPRELTIYSFVIPIFQDGFESGALDNGWSVILRYEGRVRVAGNLVPGAVNSGSYSLFLDDYLADNNTAASQAAAVLTANMAGMSVATLSFSYRSFGGASSADAVYISQNYGVDWCKIMQFASNQSTYISQQFNLIAEAARCNLVLNDHFQVKFQFFGFYGITDGANAEGFGIDNIRLVGLKPAAYLPLISR